jgi:hypothetical protein
MSIALPQEIVAAPPPFRAHHFFAVGFFRQARMMYNRVEARPVMTEPVSSRNVNAREALECIRRGMSNAELMARFKISPRGFADLLKQLFENRLINENDLASRGIRFKVVKKEAAPEPAPDKLAGGVAALLPPPEKDEGFLDTVELTELLSLKMPGLSERDAEAPPPPPPQLPEEDRDEPKEETKGRFSLSALFKKSR